MDPYRYESYLNYSLIIHSKDHKTRQDVCDLLARKFGYSHKGLNADWNCRAWAIAGDYRSNASFWVVEDEEEDTLGTFVVVKRDNTKDDDNVEEVARPSTLHDLFAIIDIINGLCEGLI